MSCIASVLAVCQYVVFILCISLCLALPTYTLPTDKARHSDTHRMTVKQPIADRIAQNLEINSKNFHFSTRRTRILKGFIIYCLVLIVSPIGRILVCGIFLEIISRFCATLSAIGCIHYILRHRPRQRQVCVTLALPQTASDSATQTTKEYLYTIY